MVVQPVVWKALLAVALGGAIILSASARAPSRPVSVRDLRRLVISALALYAVGAAASLTHHPVLAGLVYATGIAVCALAAWLSRGSDSEDPPGGQDPVDEQPPPGPHGLPWFDWASFERDFRSYSARQQERVGSR